jgi:hypothetical protein
VDWRTANTFSFFFDGMRNIGYAVSFTGKELTMRDVTWLGEKTVLGAMAHRSQVVVVAIALMLSAGCHHGRGGGTAVLANEDGMVPSDPEVQKNLAILTSEVHRGLSSSQAKLTGDFDQFVAVSGVQVPPPPAGEKYAINSKWKVILVDANAK